MSHSCARLRSHCTFFFKTAYVINQRYIDCSESMKAQGYLLFSSD